MPIFDQVLCLLPAALREQYHATAHRDRAAWKVHLRVLLEAWPSAVPAPLLFAWLEEEWPEDADAVADPRALTELHDDAYTGRQTPARPTRYVPGTPGHLAELKARAARGEALHHPDDPPRDRAAIRLARGRTANHTDTLDLMEEVTEYDVVIAREEIEAAELDAAWAKYDAVVRSYRPGTPEWEERQAEEQRWRDAGKPVTWVPALVETAATGAEGSAA